MNPGTNVSGAPAPGGVRCGLRVIGEGRGGFAFRLRAPRRLIYPLRMLLRPEPRPPDVPVMRPGPAVRGDGRSPDVTTSRSRTISTTVVGGSTTPTPQRATTGSEPPRRAIASRC